ncbi:MAG: hypothetical protein GW795_09725 [Cyanobacteria bacterium]|nr:hypothetical protein [Cyanobacteria bacterium CG_2015-16_32_12]NCO78627.1 hypothetical protein [Cyanobacteria bacterium CG_2015-22_32_23]NCQ04471.1 hypothetical protein [Cyanobacteria bacterium CG_2015-09_32_10]NCQ42151.1 hypothetical protein [Cyanobacteria bacterium CG_2015-04_32_10]NCS86134.1 hypothetical protein [Cyanobacteria bacterium CG_2015-02_32_10]
MKIFFPKNFEPQKPIKIYDHHDIMVTFFCGTINPSQFNLVILRELGIIPLDWQLEKPIISKPELLQFSFKEGINIFIAIGKISFIIKKGSNYVDLQKIIIRFIDKFNNYNWQKIQLNIRRLMSLPGSKDNGEKFMREILLNSDKWDILGLKPVKMQVTFHYPFLQNPLLINITDIKVKTKENKIKSGLLFRGTFHYALELKSTINKINYLKLIINNFSKNIELFNTIIEKKFLV